MAIREFVYEIAGKTYRQRPLVIGQELQLLNVVEGVAFTDMAPLAILKALGTKITRAVAVVLIEDGVPLKSKDLDLMTEDLEAVIDSAVILQVVDDFLDCTPIASRLEKLTGAAQRIAAKIKAIGQPHLSAASPAGT